MKYAVTGSTGKFGVKAIEALVKLVPATDIIALARNTTKAEKVLPAGVEIRPGEYTDVKTLTDSLAGVDRLLFISSLPGGDTSREQQHLNVVEVAKAAGVKFIAYTSFPHADQTQVPLAEDHQATEQALAKSGIKTAFLRNNWYLENEMGVIGPVLQGRPFIYPSDGKLGWALESDYAQAAAKVLVTEQPKAVYEFSGPARTYAELADALEAATGKKFERISASDVTDQDEQSAGFAQMMAFLIDSGALAKTNTDLADVLERPLLPLTDAVKTLI